jgi:hypothetical protein
LDKFTLAGIEAGIIASLFLMFDGLVSYAASYPSSLISVLAFEISDALFMSLIGALVLVKLRNRIPGKSMLQKAVLTVVVVSLFIIALGMVVESLFNETMLMVGDIVHMFVRNLGWAIVFSVCFSKIVTGEFLPTGALRDLEPKATSETKKRHITVTTVVNIGLVILAIFLIVGIVGLIVYYTARVPP